MDTPCINWTGVTVKSGGRESHRYGRRTVAGRKILAHRHAYEQRHGPIPPGLDVLHRCDNTLCVNPDHLFLGTHADNMADMVSKGRHWRVPPAPRRGEANPRSKLTDEQVSDIRRARAAGATTVSLAAAYGVHTSHISRLARGLRRN